ncbi:MAG: hypothetical protein H7A25_25790 [Leptospiraceae bacterium]|nr:hypothetical protein [Leptospiraceae bacterium]
METLFNRKNLKSIINKILISLSVIFTSFTFFFQVTFNSELWALVPYILLMLLVFLNIGNVIEYFFLNLYPKQKYIDFFIGIFWIIIIIKIIVTFLEYREVGEIFRYLFLYAAPVLFYFFVVSIKKIELITVLLKMIVICGMIISTQFVYESYNKSVNDKLTNFSEKAFYYSMKRMKTEDIGNANQARLSTGSRAQGILSKHSMTSAYIIICFYTLLSLIREYKKKIKFFIWSLGFSVLVLGMNTTSIVVYMIVGLWFYKDIFKISKVRKDIFVKQYLFHSLLIMFLLLSVFTVFFFEFISLLIYRAFNMLVNQLLFVFTSSKDSYTVGIIFEEILHFLDLCLEYPYLLVFGDLFKKPIYAIGGDVGFLDSITLIGFPLYLSIFTGFILFGMKLRLIKDIVINDDTWKQLELSYVSIMVFFLMDIHYSIWYDKSLIIIFFILWGIFRRNLYLLRFK